MQLCVICDNASTDWADKVQWQTFAWTPHWMDGWSAIFWESNPPTQKQQEANNRNIELPDH